ncbi:hypothetical protein [Streptomyces sp. SDr-06]|uniref:hypothetical protein n=1 Tax=Streptomyces sp. SDr-06 TaxID=2267702 RepID=UPI0016763C31|nr:hypothetical protein [Streptomyces sp. SDr-06]
MAKIDASVDEPTAVSRLADRVDVYTIAAALIRANVPQGVEPDDILRLTEWLAGDDF